MHDRKALPMNSDKTAAVIVAAGRGTRAGGDLPKQWQSVAGKPVLEWTLQAFRSHPEIGPIVLVLHPDDIEKGAQLAVDYTVCGGAERSASVRAGLDALARSGSARVLIHDVARPCVSAKTISDVLSALDHNLAAAPAVAVTDALWRGSAGKVSGTQSREGLFRAQTPQGFHLAAIQAAHASHPGGAADDVEVARAAGLEVAIVAGDEDNLKVTLPGDFARAARILEQR